MKKYLLLFLMAVTALWCNAETPAEVLQKSLSKLKGASGISCSFSGKGSAGSLYGKFEAKGNKFHITTPQGETWYDGTTMWTLSKATKEVTIVTPTAQEISEVNPLAYLNAPVADYRLFFSKRKDAANYLVLLNPKKKNSGIKAVEIGINKKSFIPVHVMVKDNHNSVSSVNISGVTLKNISDGVFKFNAKSYPGYEIVDLR